ncbi:MAG: flagellar biosynthesis anti-sigma factor FlgM [Rickettsiales bacterium]|nr:flagellar biosynthesis anti-sigma factor FlgM [Rickettsiales bacterium]|tara:strand:+ start:140 stop:463 length:324 start_codon:yes stop_codon:yes gene_type:complete
MVDQIKSKINTNFKQNSLESSKEAAKQVAASVNKVKSPENNQNAKNVNQNVSKFISKDSIKQMSKEPPIDKANVSRIKMAIANGTYPVDLEKISDALLDAYKEMKDR